MSKMHLHEIQNQSWSSLVGNFMICQGCRVVDYGNDRVRIGFLCPTCGEPSPAGQLYFQFPIHSLIDLIQESFHSSTTVKSYSVSRDKERHNLSVILYFCTLLEVLLSHLIEKLCAANQISEPIFDRLMSDNKTLFKRQNNLLRSLTGKKWNELLKESSVLDELDYVQLGLFLDEVVEKRNEFMHSGSHWTISNELKTECAENIWPMLNLFVSIHNNHVHPIYHPEA